MLFRSGWQFPSFWNRFAPAIYSSFGDLQKLIDSPPFLEPTAGSSRCSDSRDRLYGDGRIAATVFPDVGDLTCEYFKESGPAAAKTVVGREGVVHRIGSFLGVSSSDTVVWNPLRRMIIIPPRKLTNFWKNRDTGWNELH